MGHQLTSFISGPDALSPTRARGATILSTMRSINAYIRVMHLYWRPPVALRRLDDARIIVASICRRRFAIAYLRHAARRRARRRRRRLISRLVGARSAVDGTSRSDVVVSRRFSRLPTPSQGRFAITLMAFIEASRRRPICRFYRLSEARYILRPACMSPAPGPAVAMMGRRPRGALL